MDQESQVSHNQRRVLKDMVRGKARRNTMEMKWNGHFKDTEFSGPWIQCISIYIFRSFKISLSITVWISVNKSYTSVTYLYICIFYILIKKLNVSTVLWELTYFLACWDVPYQSLPFPCPWWVAISFPNAYIHAKSLQLCPTLCNSMDSSPPGSSVHGIL